MSCELLGSVKASGTSLACKMTAIEEASIDDKTLLLGESYLLSLLDSMLDYLKEHADQVKELSKTLVVWLVDQLLSLIPVHEDVVPSRVCRVAPPEAIDGTFIISVIQSVVDYLKSHTDQLKAVIAWLVEYLLGLVPVV